MIIWKKICATLSCVAVIMSMLVSGSTVQAEEVEEAITATEVVTQDDNQASEDIENPEVNDKDDKTNELVENITDVRTEEVGISDSISGISDETISVELSAVLTNESRTANIAAYSLDAPRIATDAVSFGVSASSGGDIIFEKWKIRYWGQSIRKEEGLLISLYKDDVFIKDILEVGTGGKGIETLDLSPFITESGTYKIRAMFVKPDKDGSFVVDHDYYLADGDFVHSEDFIYSKFSDYSNELIYVKPESQLGTTTAYWDEIQPYIFHFDAVEGGSHYYIYIGAYILHDFGEYGTDYVWAIYTLEINDNYISSGVSKDSSIYTVDLRKNNIINSKIDSEKINKFVVMIRTISDDVNITANSTMGNMSNAYEVGALSETQLSCKEAIDCFSSFGMRPWEIREKICSEFSLTEIIEAVDARNMSASDVILSDYAAQHIIWGYATTSYLADSDNDNIQLEVSQPNIMKILDPQYSNCVQLDIKLNKNGTYIHNLDFPISIEMTVPKGIDASKLIILHYLEDGGVEEVPYQLSDNYDGSKSMRFTVTKLSTFAFIEAPEVVDNATVATENVSNIMTSPKTTDTTHIWIAIMLLLTSISGMSIMVLRKRR